MTVLNVGFALRRSTNDKLALSARSGTTVRNFFVFFAELCVHATLLIIVRSFSNLRCWKVHHLSFQEKETELIYLHYRLFLQLFMWHVFWSIYWPKNAQKDGSTVKKPKLIFNLFPERKMIWKNFKQIRIPENSIFKWYKNDINEI